MSDSNVLAALAPVLVLAAGLVIYCWVDIARSAEVAYLPKWAWALVCVVSIPLGAIAYLIWGRRPGRPS